MLKERRSASFLCAESFFLLKGATLTREREVRKVCKERVFWHFWSVFVWTEAKRAVEDDSYLVDPASSHMLVSKIKPCMSKYKHLYTVKLRTAH